MKNDMKQLFEDQRSVHVLYSYHEMSQYIEQAVDFIQDGIAAGDCILLVENERIYQMIEKELRNLLTEDQWKFLHFVNNFDFYYSSGSYHPPAITEYFQKTVQPYVENGISFRSWAHVEWTTMEDPLHLIDDFEKIVDNAVNELSFPLICAYKGEKMPDYLRDMLMETHPYVLVEGNIVPSNQYQPIANVK